MRKVTRESYTHDMEFENDYRYCDDCYPTILKKRLNKYKTTESNILEILKAEEGAMMNRRRIVRKDNALSSEVGVSQYFLVNGCFVDNGVHDFVFLIHGFNPIRQSAIVEVMMGMELLDFTVSSMGYMEYNEVKNNLPLVVFKNSVDGYAYPIGEVILEIKKSVK